MSKRWGGRALVVGAGIGGLAAAAALAAHFEHVSVLERDELPSLAAQRNGVPQGKHVHLLLAGGQLALASLFPDFERDLRAAGAVSLRAGVDVWLERGGFSPFPQRDLGWVNYALSRPLLERCLRQRLTAMGVPVRDRCRVERLRTSTSGEPRVEAVELSSERGAELVQADLVVDASGRGDLTLDTLAAAGLPAPEETSIGTDMLYATGVFASAGAPRSWKVLQLLPNAPEDSRGALLVPIEGERWMVGLAGRADQKPPGDWQGFLSFAKSLPSRILFDAIEHAPRLGEVTRFGFNASTWRRFERARLPIGLLPVGDAVCRFNPIYGQGMSVAAQEACLLSRLLRGPHPGRGAIATLTKTFFRDLPELLEAPWELAALPDLVFPDARGERPARFAERVAYAAGLVRLAAEDPVVHRLLMRVQHLVEPYQSLQTPDILARVERVILPTLRPLQKT